MARKSNLFLNTFLLSIGTIIPKVLMVIMLPLYTYYLTKREYGIYDLTINIINLIIPIITLQIPSGVFRMLLNDKNHKKIISSSFYILLISSIISFLLFILIPYEYSYIKLLIIIYLLLTLFFQLLLEICRGLDLKKKYVTASILNSVLLAGFSIIFLIPLKLGVYGIFLALIISQLISNVYLTSQTKFVTYISIHDISKKYMLRLIKYSFPLIPNTLSWWIVNLSDRLMIAFFLGIETTAVYAIANKIPSIYSLFYNAFNLSWQEDASIKYNSKNSSKYYTLVFNNLIEILFYGLIILIGIIPLAFKILVNQDYAMAYDQMPILCISLLFSSISTFLGGIYIAQEKTNKLAISTIIAAIINVLINFSLLKVIGLYAASISTLTSYFILSIYRYIDINRKINIEIDIKRTIKFIIPVILTIILFYNKSLVICTIFSIIALLLFIKNMLSGFIMKHIKLKIMR